MELKKTPFYQKHLQDKGRIVDFSGWALPSEYKSMLAEAKAVRLACGIFDASHMGEIEIKGNDALRFINYITVNDASSLKEYQVQYSALCYDNGGMVDDLLVYRFPHRYLLVVNAANTDKDFKWILQHKRGEVALSNISDSITQIAVQGPVVEKVLQSRKKILSKPQMLDILNVYLAERCWMATPLSAFYVMHPWKSQQ